MPYDYAAVVAAQDRARARRARRHRPEPTERPLDRGSLALAEAKAERRAQRRTAPPTVSPAPREPERPRSAGRATVSDTRATFDAVLHAPCPAHAADRGTPCYEVPLGVCGQRVGRALGRLPGVPHRPFYNGQAVQR